MSFKFAVCLFVLLFYECNQVLGEIRMLSALLETKNTFRHPFSSILKIMENPFDKSCILHIITIGDVDLTVFNIHQPIVISHYKQPDQILNATNNFWSDIGIHGISPMLKPIIMK